MLVKQGCKICMCFNFDEISVKFWSLKDLLYPKPISPKISNIHVIQSTELILSRLWVSELLLYFCADTAAPGTAVADSCLPGRPVCCPVILFCTHPGIFVLSIVPHPEVYTDLDSQGSQADPSLSPRLPATQLWQFPQKCKNWCELAQDKAK